MTLTIHTEENEQRELKLTIEVAEKRVEKAMRQTARKLVRDINMPGFRRGKAPYNVIMRRVGREALRAEAIDEMVQGVFEEALEQVEPEVYGRPSFDEMEMEPLVLKFTIPLAPQVDLGDYRALRKAIESITISDEAVDEALEQVQLRHQQAESVDRPAAAGDLVTISGHGELVWVEDDDEEVENEVEEGAVEEAAEDVSDEVEIVEDGDIDDDDYDYGGDDDDLDDNDDDDYQDVIFDEESIDLLLDADKLYLGAPFVDELVGMSAGDTKSFTIDFPDDFQDEELAGKEADFEISVLDVKEREIPALDDELAKLAGDYETLEELRDALRKQLEKQAESEAKNALIEGMIDDMLEGAQINYPPAAVEAEIDDMLASFKEQVTRSGWEWEDYLRLQSDTEDDIRDNFRESAAERLERQQVLRQFVLSEMLTMDADDVDTAVAERLESYDDNKQFQESMRKFYQSGYGFEMISSEIMMDKVHERMTAVLTGDAPDLDALAAAAEAAKAATDEEE